jgi:hypothetical protein
MVDRFMRVGSLALISVIIHNYESPIRTLQRIDTTDQTQPEILPIDLPAFCQPYTPWRGVHRRKGRLEAGQILP